MPRATRPATLRSGAPRDRTLLCGDVFTNIDTLTGLPGLHEPKSFFTPDPSRNRESMRRLAALGPELVLFGHGRPRVTRPSSAPSRRSSHGADPRRLASCSYVDPGLLVARQSFVLTRPVPARTLGRGARHDGVGLPAGA